MKTLSNSFNTLVYGSYLRVAENLYGPDEVTRKPEFTRLLFRKLGISWDRWPRAVVVGSKGKGSTALFLSSILAASGERVGTVTSPHLVSFTERIRVDGRCVSVEELEQAARSISSVVEDVQKTIRPPEYVGPQGIILSLAWTIFRKRGVTAVVVEAGRGGEYDEAGCIDPQVIVLTPVMGEHKDKLGHSPEAIARTKVRIAPAGSVIVSAAQTPRVHSVIQTIAKERGCSVSFVEANVSQDITVPVGGEYQIHNASLAVLAAKKLTGFGVTITKEGVLTGLQKVKLYGRLQVLGNKPLVVLDGTINRESAGFACDYVKARVKRVIPVVAIPKPKDLEGVLSEVSRISDTVILTELAKPSHISWYGNAQKVALTYFPAVRVIKPSERAYKTAMNDAGENGAVLLLGTQVFVGNALSFWNINPCSIW